MTHRDCYTDQQGRFNCTCGQFEAQKTGANEAPFHWVDDLVYSAKWTMVFVAIAFSLGSAFLYFLSLK